MSKTLVEYAKLIREWSTERGLHDKDPKKQILKLGEEAGELFSGIAKQKPEMIMDAVGDVFVVLVIYCQQRKVEIDEVLKILLSVNDGQQVESTDATYYSLKLMHKIGMIANTTIYSDNENTILLQVSWALEELLLVSKACELDFIDCIDYAYNQIKNRDGELRDGTFVKREDL
ncbi:MazG-like family protein [Macrococcus capreoli]|uniref:MazG-like family protein n=1 Tax=Macrococcus capreoli TaxID=2982690 RepID=UPI003F41BD34